MHHHGDRNQEQHKKPAAEFCVIAQQNAQASGDGQDTRKRTNIEARGTPYEAA